MLATNDVPGSKILLTTKDQSHVIADIFFAKESYLNSHRKMIDGFYEGWMKAVAELKANPSNREKAAKYMAETFQLGVADAMGMMEVVHWTSHGDNVNFFWMNPEYRGQRGEDLYTKMSKNFIITGDATAEAPAWRSSIFTGAIQSASSTLTGPAYAAETGKTFSAPTAEAKSAPAIASKPVSINFASGKFALDENSKTIIDLQFADVAKSFANARWRFEGNTSNVGAKANKEKT